MSIRAIKKVWDNFPGKGPELLTMLALADWADDNGRCWPSIAALAEKMRVSRSQAQRTTHKLIDAGFLAVVRNEHGGPPRSTRHYQINLDRLTDCTDATDSTGATGSADAADGSHPRAKTGRTDATQNVNEPSRTVKGVRTRSPTKFALPEDFVISEGVQAWAKENGHRNLDDHFAAFVLKAKAKGYMYADWDSALKEAIRKNWAGLDTPKGTHQSTRHQLRASENFDDRNYGQGGLL